MTREEKHKIDQPFRGQQEVMSDTYMVISRNHNSVFLVTPLFLQMRTVVVVVVVVVRTPHLVHVTLRRLTPNRVWQRKRPPSYPSTVSFSASSPHSHLLPRSSFLFLLIKMAAAIKAINAKIRSNKVLDYVCSTRTYHHPNCIPAETRDLDNADT